MDKVRSLIHFAILVWLIGGYFVSRRFSWTIDVVAFGYFIFNVVNFAYVVQRDQSNAEMTVMEKETEHVVMLIVQFLVMMTCGFLVNSNYVLTTYFLIPIDYGIVLITTNTKECTPKHIASIMAVLYLLCVGCTFLINYRIYLQRIELFIGK